MDKSAQMINTIKGMTVENSSTDGNTTLPTLWKICMQLKKQQLEPDME